MKQVKSKITGDIGELDFDSKEGVFIVIYYDLHTKATIKNYYKSLEDLCEGWEDYEEPKEYWYIDTAMMEVTYNTSGAESDVEEFNKEVGNYFETEEEAEKAVEKLKAWKRLKDKGFKYTGWEKNHHNLGIIYFDFGNNKHCASLLNLLFGGEE